MNERPHPTAEDFLRYCARKVSETLIPCGMTKGGETIGAARAAHETYLRRSSTGWVLREVFR